MVVISEGGTSLVLQNSGLGVDSGWYLETNMGKKRKAKSRHSDNKSVIRSKGRLTGGTDSQKEEDDRMAAALAMSALANGSVLGVGGSSSPHNHDTDSAASVSPKLGQMIVKPFYKPTDPPMEFKVNLPKRNNIKDVVKHKLLSRGGVKYGQSSESCEVDNGENSDKTAAKNSDKLALFANGHVKGICNSSTMRPAHVRTGNSQEGEISTVSLSHNGGLNKHGSVKETEGQNKQAHLPPKKRRLAETTSDLEEPPDKTVAMTALDLTLNVVGGNSGKGKHIKTSTALTPKHFEVATTQPRMACNVSQSSNFVKADSVTNQHNISQDETSNNVRLVVSDGLVSRSSGVVSVANTSDSSKKMVPPPGSLRAPGMSVKTAVSVPSSSPVTQEDEVDGECIKVQPKHEQRTEDISPTSTSKFAAATVSKPIAENVQLPMPIADPQRSLMMLAECQMAIRPDEDGDLPLHIAAVQGDLAAARTLVRLMMASRVAIDACNKLRQAPLHLAVITDQPEMVHLLLSAGASPNLPDRHGNTSLHLAARNRCKECLKVILNHSRGKVNLNAKNYEGFAALHLAVQVRESALVTSLIGAGADLDVQDGKSGRTPLYHACETNQHHLVEILLKHGSNVNLQSYAGATPLHAASGRSYMDIVALLVRFGADTTVKNVNVDFFFTTRTEKKGSKNSNKVPIPAAASSSTKSSAGTSKLSTNKPLDSVVSPSGNNVCTPMQSRLMTTGGTVTVVSSAGPTNMPITSIHAQPLPLLPQMTTPGSECGNLTVTSSPSHKSGPLPTNQVKVEPVTQASLSTGPPKTTLIHHVTPPNMKKDLIPPLPLFNVAKSKSSVDQKKVDSHSNPGATQETQRNKSS